MLRKPAHIHKPRVKQEMKKVRNVIILLVLFIITFSSAYAQKENNVWAFGDSAGLDLNSGVPVPIITSMHTIEGSASVCTDSGQLLFYTEGSVIWDHNGNIMPNGNNLTGLGTWSGLTPTASTTQSSLIVPMPDSLGKYYVFSLTDGSVVNVHHLYYSIVDMSLNGGNGDVVAGRKGILIDSSLAEKLTGVVGKRCNIWVVVNHTDGNFHAFEITSSGINTTPVTSPSGINNGFGYNYGEIKFSPDGNHMAAVSQSFFGLKLYDFDGATGIFSNIRTINHHDSYGANFSPDNSKLYIASDSLYQYDVTQSTATGIQNSEYPVVWVGGLTDVKLASNGKIYFDGMEGLSVVNFPNLSGAACQAQPGSISLLPGTYIIFGGLTNVVPVFYRDTVYDLIPVTACFNDSLTLYANDSGWDYHWENGDSQTYSIVHSSGQYVVHYTTAPCVYHTDTFSVLLKSGLPVPGSFGGCRHGGNGFAWVNPAVSDTNTYTYTWSNASGAVLQTHTRKETGDTLAALQQGVYTVNMFGVDSCDTTFNITVYGPDSAGFTLPDTTCQHQPVTLVNTSFIGNNTVDYTWHFGDDATDTAANPVATFNTSGDNTVSLVANFGFCSDTATHHIYIVPFSVSINNDFCFGDSVRLYPVITAPSYFSNYSYTWSPATGLDSADILSPLFYEPPGSYTYVFTINAPVPFGCTLNDTIAINIFDKPVLTGVTASQTIPYGSSIQLNASGANFYVWVPNNGTLNNPNISDPIATPLDSTTYMVAGMDSAGCSDTAWIAINIGYSNAIFIPTAFSPNNDGKNDVFRIRNITGQKLLEMRIFNRWGKQLFYSTDPDMGWDGTYKGVPQDIDTYSYLIILDDPNGKEQMYKGTVTLVR